MHIRLTEKIVFTPCIARKYKTPMACAGLGMSFCACRQRLKHEISMRVSECNVNFDVEWYTVIVLVVVQREGISVLSY